MHGKRFEVLKYFLRLGLVGFGGPLAMIAQMQKDLVENRKWISEDRFIRAFALIKALPGPIAPQVAIFISSQYAGKLAGFLAGTCLVLPAFFLILVLATFYGNLSHQAWSQPVLFGMQAAALGVIAESIWGLSRSYTRSIVFWMIAAFAAIISFMKPSMEPALILGSGVLGMIWFRTSQKKNRADGQLHLGISMAFAASSTAPLALASSTTTSLAWLALKSGAFIFGSGVAIVPLLMHDVVNVHHWLTHQQFMDALAFGQITPGPVVITITFIGYTVAGLTGAIVATVGIFAPCFFNALTWFPAVEERLGRTPYAAAFAKWAIAAVVGTLAIAVGKLALSPLAGASLGNAEAFHFIWWFIAVAALVVQRTGKAPSWFVIPAGGVAGLIVKFLV